MPAKVALHDADKIYSQWELKVGPVEQWLELSLGVLHMQNHITLKQFTSQLIGARYPRALFTKDDLEMSL